MKRALLLAPLLLLSGAAPKSKLVPVVIAAVDIPAGTVVTFEMISQRSVEPSAANAAIVKPDSASYIVNQKVSVPVLAGDLMRWTFFEVASKGVAAGCPPPKGTAQAQVDAARARVLAK